MTLLYLTGTVNCETFKKYSYTDWHSKMYHANRQCLFVQKSMSVKGNTYALVIYKSSVQNHHRDADTQLLDEEAVINTQNMCNKSVPCNYIIKHQLHAS